MAVYNVFKYIYIYVCVSLISFQKTMSETRKIISKNYHHVSF